MIFRTNLVMFDYSAYWYGTMYWYVLCYKKARSVAILLCHRFEDGFVEVVSLTGDTNPPVRIFQCIHLNLVTPRNRRGNEGKRKDRATQ